MENKDKIKELKDVYNYINKHHWLIGNCDTQKAELEYSRKVLLKIKQDLALVFEDVEKDFVTGEIH